MGGYEGLIVPEYPEDRKWEKVAALAMTVYAIVVAALMVAPHRGELRAWCAELRDSLRTKPPKHDDEARERRIRDECEKRRVERFRFLAVLSCTTVFVHGPTLIAGISFDKVNLAEAIVLMTFGAGKITAALFSNRFTSRAVDAFYCFHILMNAMWCVTHEPSVEAIFQDRAVMLSTMLLWGAACVKPWMNALGFLFVAMVEGAMLVLAGGASLVLKGLFLYPIGFALLVGLDYCLKKSVRMEILAGDSENELEAIKTLLDTICDVVVHLDGRLRLKQHSAKLSDVLMIRAPNRNLEGQDLRSYMATEADGANFTHHLQGSGAALAHAGVFHAKMRDNSGSNIDMEFFSVGFRGRDGDQHHILGMREFTDIRPVLPDGANQAAGTPAPATPPPPPFEPGQEPAPPPPPPREREEGLGTPAVLEQGDIRSHRTSSSHEWDSEVGDPEAPPMRTFIETSEVAKLITINYLLASWAIAPASDACCPKHTAINALGKLITKMRKRAPCIPDFGPSCDWQCPRCGIADDEYKDRRHKKRCLLCKDFDDAVIHTGTNARGDRASL